MAHAGPERRKYPRISGRFIVSYRIAEEEDGIDISQTRNASLGGILMTTNKKFEPGVKLILQIRFPFDPEPITITGKVISSREITKDLIYDTAVEFLSVDERHKKVISDTIEYYLKRGNKV